VLRGRDRRGPQPPGTAAGHRDGRLRPRHRRGGRGCGDRAAATAPAQDGLFVRSGVPLFPRGPDRPGRGHHRAGGRTRTMSGASMADKTPAPRWQELARLKKETHFFDAVIDEIDGRMIRIGDHWLADFASCNYLGFDLDPEIMAAPQEQIARWGTHPSWSRLLGNPRLYPEIEERLTELLSAPDTLVLPTITTIHLTAIPVLANKGTVLCEAQAHRTIFDGCSVAKGQGAQLHRWHS